MLLAIDVGNTNTVFGIHDGKVWRASFRLESNPERTYDEYAALLRQLMELEQLEFGAIDSVVVASVVPTLQFNLERFARKYFHTEALFVGPGTKTGIPIRYDNPKDVGADRIVNAVGALALFSGPLIVVDFGTATTFDAVSAKGEYLGGAIVPGIHISMDALFRHAAKLPRVEFVRPPQVIGTNTIHAMQSGLVFGYAAMVDGIVGRMRESLGVGARVLATGGLASLIAADSKTIQTVDENLTLDGLRLIFERNRA